MGEQDFINDLKEGKQSAYGKLITDFQQKVFATCISFLNIIAFTQLKQDSYNDNITQFAESYGLSISDETSLLN